MVGVAVGGKGVGLGVMVGVGVTVEVGVAVLVLLGTAVWVDVGSALKGGTQAPSKMKRIKKDGITLRSIIQFPAKNPMD
jgi:hypothetical protein